MESEKEPSKASAHSATAPSTTSRRVSLEVPHISYQDSEAVRRGTHSVQVTRHKTGMEDTSPGKTTIKGWQHEATLHAILRAAAENYRLAIIENCCAQYRRSRNQIVLV